jgi:hypothetical protein
MDAQLRTDLAQGATLGVYMSAARLTSTPSRNEFLGWLESNVNLR